MKKIITILYIYLCSFSISYALVEIQELMYNPDGSDTNREWIEIYNNGQSLDISSWYFLENDTYHGLYPDGFSSLETGDRALIVKDIASAQSELGSGIKYIKSSFSLNNTGETITIADSNKNNINTYTYNNELGGNGDGNSLQLIGSSWFSAKPTPAKLNKFSGEDSSGEQVNNNTNNDIKPAEIVYSKPYYEAKLEVSDVIVAQSDFNIKAEVYHIKNGKKTKEIDGYYFINFGNGDVLESNKRIDTHYRYRKEGEYILVFEYYNSKFAFDHGKEADSILKKKISVIKHDIEIIKVEAFDGVVLKNNTNSIVDLHNWKIIFSGKSYVFPRYSYISAGNQINILFETLNFSPFPSAQNSIQLLSDANKPISYFPKSMKKKKNIKYKHRNKKNIKKEDQNNLLKTLDFEKLEDANVDFFGNNTDSYLDQYLDNNPNKLKVDFGKNEFVVTTDIEDSNKNNNSIYYALASLILMLGAGRFAKHRNKTEDKKEIDDFGSIEIIE